MRSKLDSSALQAVLSGLEGPGSNAEGAVQIRTRPAGLGALRLPAEPAAQPRPGASGRRLQLHYRQASLPSLEAWPDLQLTELYCICLILLQS